MKYLIYIPKEVLSPCHSHGWLNCQQELCTDMAPKVVGKAGKGSTKFKILYEEERNLTPLENWLLIHFGKHVREFTSASLWIIDTDLPKHILDEGRACVGKLK